MADPLEGIDDALASWLEAQPVYFVATAPMSTDGRVNLSPKGMAGTFRVLDEHTVAYLDHTGSGAETIAHLRENGRITVMFCAFEGRPRIVRLYGTGRVVLPGDDEYGPLAARFSEHAGVRSVIVVDVTSGSSSCGYGVPEMDFVADRRILDLDAAKKGPEKLAAYRRDHNAVSIDGLPALPPMGAALWGTPGMEIAPQRRTHRGQ